MRIALDAMGGDHAPRPIVEGGIQALCNNSALEVSFVGEANAVPALLEELAGDVADRCTFVESEGVVGMHEKPMEALRQKPRSSISECWRLKAQGSVDAVVSAGNTGAVVAAGLRTRLFLKGVRRPGIAVTLPTLKGRSVLIDVGANPAGRAEHLYQYAVMGRIFAREMLGVENPRVGLMNIGSEDSKGNDLCREAHALLSASPLRDAYVGNVEGRGLYQGEADVLVCEGFVGNIVLKVSEGMADFLLQTVAGAVLESLDQERDLAAAAMMKLRERYRYQEAGGAPLLGIDGICIICHGSSCADSIRNALRTASEMQAHKINAQIVERLAELNAMSAASA